METVIDISYMATHAAILRRVDQLRDLIENMPAPDSGNKIDWGHVGTLSHINQRLHEIIESLTNAK